MSLGAQQTLPRILNALTNRPFKPRSQLQERLPGPIPMPRNHLCRFRRRMRMIIRDKIADRAIHFMPNPSHNRNARPGNRPGDNFLIERPEILQ